MKIRTQLIISIIIFSLALLIISASVISTDQKVVRLNAQDELAISIELKANELGYLSNDYLLYQESQQVDRWESKYASINDDLANLTVDTSDQQVLVNNIKASQQRLREVFDDIVAHNAGTSPAEHNTVDPAFIQVSSSRIGVQTQGMVFDASRLSRKIMDEKDQLKLVNYLLIIALLGVFGVFLLTIYYLIYKRTLKSIADLQVGTEIIGSGGLDHVIPEKKDDEFGELAGAFNRMTARLKTVTASKADLEREVTERKRAEDALRASEVKYRSIVETATEGIWMADPDGRTTFVNETMAEMIGYSPEEMIGKSAYDFMDEEARAIASQNLKQRRQGLRGSYEQKYIRKDGTTLWAIVSATPGQDKNGQLISIMGMLTDITERKRAEEELRKSEALLLIANESLLTKQGELQAQAEEMEVQLEELRATNDELEKVTNALRASEETARRHAEELEKLMDVVPAAIWVSHDPKCHEISGNKAANRFYEAKEGDNVSAGPLHVEQDTTRRFFRNGRELMPDELTMQEAASKGVDVLNSELEVLLPSGRQMTILGNASPLRDAGGNVRGCVGAFVDITERKQAEKELLEAKMQAELYLDLMGHDINNMHQIAIGYLEIARDALTLDESEKFLIDKPLETMQRSAKLIENVRKLQRVQAGEIKEDVVNLDDILGRVIREYREIAGGKIAYNDGGGSHKVMANELLYDVFANLVGNAVKHSGCNGRDIGVSVGLAWDGTNRYYQVSVEDNGPGIPDALKDKVFNRLQRGETLARGVGLGLYLVKSLVESYHGRVWVEDRVSGDYSKGSRFVVMLPAIDN